MAYTEDELFAKLERADAAGDTEAAKVIADEIRSLRGGPSLVTPRVQQTRQSAGDYMGPMQGMSAGDKAWAGAGAAAVSQGRGLGQAATYLMDAQNPGFTGVTDQIRAQLAEEEAQQRQVDAPLMETPEGRGGSVGGYVAPLLAGGVALRGTAAGAAFMPRTIPGAAAQGAVIGATQPVVSESERFGNTGLGALAGAGGQAIPMVAGNGLRRLSGLVHAPTQAGIEQRAAQTIRGMATLPDPGAAPSAIPGVTRTLAEETLDPGIAQLQRQFPVQMAERSGQNNAARMSALRNEFKGADDAAIAAIEQQRDQEARMALRGLRSKTGVAIEPVTRTVDALMAKQKGRPAVQQALAYVKTQLESGIENADQAYNVRKTIGDLMEGRLSGDLASAKTAKNELLIIRGMLDRQMRQAVPAWGAYLKGYRSASREADQVRVGQTLMERGASATENAATGERTLTPDRVARLTNDPDALARQATGFRKAKADAILTPGQGQVIGAVRDDLRRVQFADQAGRGAGSPTAQNIETRRAMGRIAGAVSPSALTSLVAIAKEAYAGKVNDAVADLLLNPQKARIALARLPAKDRALIEREIARLSGITALGLESSRE